MDTNQEFIQNLKVKDVPWHRLTTAYGRATDFPKYFDVLWAMEDLEEVKNALKEIIWNIEHQSTLWQATPFAMVFLTRIFKHAFAVVQENTMAYYIAEELLDFFIMMAECFREGEGMEHAMQLPLFADMLKEEYLWSEEYDEGEDEIRYEEEEVFPDNLFYSFYYYAFQVLLGIEPTLEIIGNANSELKVKSEKLQILL